MASYWVDGRTSEKRSGRVKGKGRSQAHGTYLHRCPRHTRGVLRRGPRPLGGAGEAEPAQGFGRPGSPRQCMAPGFEQWGRSLPEPEGKQERSAPSSISCLLPPCPLCPHTCNCLGRREGNMRPGQSQSFTEGVRK